MDAASSEWKTGKVGEYKLPRQELSNTSEQLIEHWKKLVEKYPIIPSRMPLMRKTGKDGKADRRAWNEGTVSR